MHHINEKVEFLMFPPFDPRLRKNLCALYHRMNYIREHKNSENIKNPKLRRCNRCGKYFLVEHTVLRKYHINSHRKYRLCISCEKALFF